MSERPWMPLYVGDYLADTRHLSTEEHGAYFLLIMHYWRAGGLPDDDARLARIAGLTPEGWAESRATIVAFFDECWKHKRIDKELAEAERLSNRGRAGGIASGEARRANRTTVEQSLPSSSNQIATKREAPQSQPQSLSKSSFKGIGLVKSGGWSPPKHGATGKGRIYIRSDHPDWDSYAEDFRGVHGKDPEPNQHGGKWFKVLGEASPDQPTLRAMRG